MLAFILDLELAFFTRTYHDTVLCSNSEIHNCIWYFHTYQGCLSLICHPNNYITVNILCIFKVWLNRLIFLWYFWYNQSWNLGSSHKTHSEFLDSKLVHTSSLIMNGKHMRALIMLEMNMAQLISQFCTCERKITQFCIVILGCWFICDMFLELSLFVSRLRFQWFQPLEYWLHLPNSRNYRH